MLYKRLSRRGFNLIEIAIVVVVLGLLGSAVLVPLSAVLVEEQYEREAVAIERIKRAVIGYAAGSITPGATVFLGGSRDADDTYTIPAGRAYFPCPDMTGDGHENRNHYDDIGVQISTYTATPTISVAADGAVILEQFRVMGNDTRGLDLVGGCTALRGLLPWRTLGVPPTDTWGNLYTYAVDYGYSRSIVGFNQNTLADNYDEAGLMRVVDDNLYFPINSNENGRGGLANFGDPIRLCLGAAALCQTGVGGLEYAYGISMPAATVANRAYNDNEVREGLIFMVVSHGRNGFGAGQYRPGAAAISCNRGIASTNNHENGNYPFINYGTNFPNCQNPGNRNANIFTILHRNNKDEDTAFDDVMIWATRDEVNDLITRNSPDLPLYIQAP